MQQCPLNNATMERSVNKFRGTLAKLFAEELENMDLNAMLDDDIRELYEFIGVDVPDEEKKLRFERCARCSLSLIQCLLSRTDANRNVLLLKMTRRLRTFFFVFCGSVLNPP